MHNRLPCPACWQKIFRKSDPDSDLSSQLSPCCTRLCCGAQDEVRHMKMLPGRHTQHRHNKGTTALIRSEQPLAQSQ